MMWYGVLGTKELLHRTYKNLEQRVLLEVPVLELILVLSTHKPGAARTNRAHTSTATATSSTSTTSTSSTTSNNTHYIQTLGVTLWGYRKASATILQELCQQCVCVVLTLTVYIGDFYWWLP